MADLRELRLPSDASADEAAAISAAVEQWLAAEARAAEDEPTPEESWKGRRFAFAGRAAKLTGEPVRLPLGAPTDPWTAMGRLSRD
jgi:hypothetical protein